MYYGIAKDLEKCTTEILLAQSNQSLILESRGPDAKSRSPCRRCVLSFSRELVCRLDFLVEKAPWQLEKAWLVLWRRIPLKN